MNELEEIRVFVTLVECRTASKAAEKMGLANSAISRRMKALESRLGVQLIQRTTRTMRLTEDGNRYYQRCRQLLEDWNEAEREVTRSACALSGSIRVSAPLSFGVAHLTPAISAFMHQHNDVNIDLDMSDRRVDVVEEGFDLTIRIGQLEDSTLVARKLSNIKHVVCCAPSLLKKTGPISHPEQLKSIQALCYSNRKMPGRWQYECPDGSAKSVKVPTKMLCNNGDALREAAISGLGIVCQPTFVVHQAIKSGALVPVLTDYLWFDMNLYALYPQSRHLSRRVRALLDFLSDRYGEQPYWDQVK